MYQDQEKAKHFAARAAGSQFIQTPQAALPLGADAATLQTELDSLHGATLGDRSACVHQHSLLNLANSVGCSRCEWQAGGSGQVAPRALLL